MKIARFLGVVGAAACLTGLMLVSPVAMAQDKAPAAPAATAPAKKDAKAGVTAGDKAPEFTLKAYADGKEVKLSDLLKNNKAVVIEWFNPGCPFVVRHHKEMPTFATLHKDFAGKGVAFVAINSGAKGMEGHGDEANKKAIADWKIAYPVLNDETGAVGQAYGAKRTPELFIVTPDGKIAYHGAIDNDQGNKKKGDEKVNHVRVALDEILKGTNVTTATTQAYGCSVKYAKK